MEFEIIETDPKHVMDELTMPYQDNTQNSSQNFRDLDQKRTGNGQFRRIIPLNLDSTNAQSRIQVVVHFIQHHF
jgi:hypothetical protein